MAAKSIAAVALLVLAALTGFPAVVSVLAVRNADYACAPDTYPPSPLPAVEGEVVEARGGISLWPLGLQCDYATESGASFRTDSGWWQTGLAAVAVAALACAAIVGAAQRQATRPATEGENRS